MDFKLVGIQLALLGVLSLPTLFALFVSRTRLYWLFQALLIVVFAIPLMLVRAYDLMLVVSFASLLVYVFSKIWQQRQASSESQKSENAIWASHLQVGVKDGLAAFVFLSVLLALVTYAIETSPTTLFEGSVFFGVLQCVFIGTAIAVWGFSLIYCISGFRLSKILWCVPLMVASAVAAGWNETLLESAFQVWNWLGSVSLQVLLTTPTVSKGQSIFFWMILLSAHALTVGVTAWLFGWRPSRNLQAPTNTRATFRRMLALFGGRVSAMVLLIAMSASLAFFYVGLLPPTSYVPIRQWEPNTPNGFLDLVEAGRSFENTGLVGRAPIQPGPRLARRINAHSKTYENVERALQKEHCYGDYWNCDRHDFDSMFYSGEKLRMVARALRMRALQSLGEGRHDDVVADGHRCLQIAEAVSVDGILVNLITGTGIEGIAVSVIQSGIDSASAEQLQRTAVQLDTMVGVGGDVDVELERCIRADKYFSSTKSEFHWLIRLAENVLDSASTIESVRGALVRRSVFRSLLRTEIAIQWYRRDVGQFPIDLNALVPKYIESVPDDYFAAVNQPFTYVVTEGGTEYRLYSFGPDKEDDGGEISEMHWLEGEGDWDLMLMEGHRLAENAQNVADYVESQKEEAMGEEERAAKWGGGMGSRI